MGEFELIDYFRKKAVSTGKVITGPGDDCAVVKVGKEKVLATTDVIVEGVDFEKDTPPYLVGKKAVNISLSDIAAMGGRPAFILAALSMPKGRPPEYAKRIFAGLNRAAAAFDSPLVGGDLSATPGPVTLQTTAIGRPSGKRIILRSGAKTGDAIYVTGTLGGSIFGRHLKFIPRVDESLYLNARYRINSMIDISDGLSGDLAHILAASGKGALIEERSIPVSAAAKRLAKKSGKTALYHALNDGEDFELLFTLGEKEAVRLDKDPRRAFKVSRIGTIVRKGYAIIRADGATEDVKPAGYRHSF